MTFQHRAGVSPYTSPCGFARTCVFSKQSLPPFHCNPQRLSLVKKITKGAHLFPRLRCYFAEFLNQSSLKRLGIFYLSTCVGLRYGHRCKCIRGFSWKHGINHFMTHRVSSSRLGVMRTRICLSPPPTRLNRDNQRPDDLSFFVPPYTSSTSAVREY